MTSRTRCRCQDVALNMLSSRTEDVLHVLVRAVRGHLARHIRIQARILHVVGHRAVIDVQHAYFDVGRLAGHDRGSLLSAEADGAASGHTATAKPASTMERRVMTGRRSAEAEVIASRRSIACV